MYQVTLYHRKKEWRRGDLEYTDALELQENFRTKTAAKIFIQDRLLKMSGTKRTEWHKGDNPSYACWWTGWTWQNENSGEQLEETYTFILKKVKLK